MTSLRDIIPKSGGTGTFIVNAFARQGITTLEELGELSDKEVMHLGGIGPKHRITIKEVMRKHGYEWKMQCFFCE